MRNAYDSSSSAVWARLLLAAKDIAVYAPYRSLDGSILVIAGWAPNSGCALRLAEHSERLVSQVVFRDPCTGDEFDSSGRLFKKGSTPLNGRRRGDFDISIPPYRIESGIVTIGLSPDQDLQPLPFSQEEMCSEESYENQLSCAARYNDIEGVRNALHAGEEINYHRRGGGRPIDSAIIGSSLEVIELLLLHGARPTENSKALAELMQRDDVISLLRDHRN